MHEELPVHRRDEQVIRSDGGGHGSEDRRKRVPNSAPTPPWPVRLHPKSPNTWARRSATSSCVRFYTFPRENHCEQVVGVQELKEAPTLRTQYGYSSSGISSKLLAIMGLVVFS